MPIFLHCYLVISLTPNIFTVLKLVYDRSIFFLYFSGAVFARTVLGRDMVRPLSVKLLQAGRGQQRQLRAVSRGTVRLHPGISSLRSVFMCTYQ